MDPSAPSGPRLLQQAEKILLHPIHPHLITYCPTMDLIALVTNEENVDVYRINGQRAFGIKRKSADVTVVWVGWQWNGAALAVCWSDRGVDVVGSETGKIVHRNVRLDVEEEGFVSLLGWGLNFIDVEAVRRRIGEKEDGKKAIDFNLPTTEDWDAFKDDTTLEDFLQRQPDFEKLDVAPDLPDQLAMMDMESLLPKLPPIPLPPANPFMMRAAKGDAGAFSSQAQVDGLLHSHHLRDHNSVDMFIRCTEKGSVHPSIYDSMEAVDIRLPESWNVHSKPLAHTSHPYACTHGLLMAILDPKDHAQQRIAYVPLTLGFIPSAGIYLHLIASKTAQLQNLLSYLTHTLARIKAYFTQSRDLPTKFMRNISETLEEQGLGGLVENLYHLACTGHCSPTMHEWLVDELAEQGHKRWDNAMTSGMTTVIQLLHENFVPAIDRCSIIISRLRGLTKYHDQAWIFSDPLSNFTEILDQLKQMRLLALTTLLYAADEKRHFASFSKWLRYSIEFEATEPDSQSRAEMEARDPGVDVGTVLSYIEHNLANSDIGSFLTSVKEVDGVEEAGYEDTRKAIEIRREGVVVERNGALCLEGVLQRFGRGVQGLLRQVSDWQKENISMDCGIVLEEGEVGSEVDMRMVCEPSDTDSISTYIALLSPPTSTPSTLTLHRLTHSPHLTNLSSSLQTYSTTTLAFPPSSPYKIIDAKFADNTTLLILITTSQPPTTSTSTKQKTPPTKPLNLLISLPYTPSSSNKIITYTPHPQPETHSTFLPHGRPLSSSSTSTLIKLTPNLVQNHTRHVFEGRFTPLKLVVNGREGRRVVVVLGSDCRHYRVLDLDFREARAKEVIKAKEGAGSVLGGSDDGGWSGDSEGDEDGDVEMGGA